MIKQKKSPKRLCSGCQTFQDKKAMVRIVRTPTGEVVVDPTGKAPGRGVAVIVGKRSGESFSAMGCSGLKKFSKMGP